LTPMPWLPRGRAPSAFGLLALQQALAGLAQRDRQRLLLHAGLNERADVLKKALAELRVVGVDLASPLRGEDHQPVLAVNDLEQLVDRRVDDAVRALGHSHVFARSSLTRVNRSTSCRLRRTVSPARGDVPGRQDEEG